MYYIATGNERPDWLVYPPLFQRMVEQGVVNLCPWHITPAHQTRSWLYQLEKLYPKRNLYPFAFRQDNNDVACWEEGRGDLVIVVHDVTEHDSPDQSELPNTGAWLALAMQDMIDWD